MLLALLHRLPRLLAKGLLLGLAARTPVQAQAQAEAFLHPQPHRVGTLLPKTLAGLAPPAPPPRWKAGMRDLWFRPEPIRRRWHLTAISNGQASVLAIEHASLVGNSPNGAGWWLGLRILLQPWQANPLMAAGPVALESSRWTLGYQRPAGQLWWGVFAGMARQSLDLRGLLLTGQAVRLGPVIGVHGWLTLTLPASQPSGFVQIYAEYDDARAAWAAVIRAGLPVSGGEIRLGPELMASIGFRLQAYGLTYREPFRLWRAGLHLRGFHIARARLSLSVGREQAAREAPRPYALMELGLAY